MQEQTAVAVRAAEVALERKERIEAVIQSGVGELSALIVAQLQAEREFRRLECQAAIGEVAPGLEKAKKAAESAKAALREASLRLGGFRQQLGGMGTEFVRNWDGLAAEIPVHNADLVEVLTGEWQLALAGWQVALGRRAAVEGLIGRSLNLPDPLAAPVDIGEAGKPHQVLVQLAAGLKKIAGMKTIAERQLRSTTFYDRNAVYRIVSDRWANQGIPKGTFVIDASFEPGRLAQIIELEYARPVLDRDLSEGITIAATKAEAIERDRVEKDLAESERKLHQPISEDLKRSGRMVGPEYEGYKPSQADLDRIDEKNRQVAARSSSPSDTSLGAH